MFAQTRQTLLPLLLLLLAAPTAALAEEGLRWQFAEGDHYEIGLGEQVRMYDNFRDDSEDQQSNINIYFDWQVRSVDDTGTATIDLTYERILFTWKTAAGGLVVLDTAEQAESAGDAQELAAALDSLLGEKVTFTLTPRSEIEGLEFSEEVSEIFEQAGDESLLSEIDQEWLMACLQRCMPVLPAELEASPEEWITQIESNSFPIEAALFEIRFARDENRRSDRTGATRYSIYESYSLQREEDEEEYHIQYEDTYGDYSFDLSAGRLHKCYIYQSTYYYLGDPTVDYRGVSATARSEINFWEREEE